MAGDDDHLSLACSLTSMQWSQTLHVDPKSHQEMRLHEWSELGLDDSHVALSFGIVSHDVQRQRQPPHSQSSSMPAWPSMLSSQSHSNLYAHHVRTLPTGAPKSSTPAVRTTFPSVSRKKLTDLDRKRMCQYAEEHCDSKQREIGVIFGVDRNTVSKVPRHKERYMQGDGWYRPAKCARTRFPDINRALDVWARNQVKNGISPSDDQIRETIRLFSSPISCSSDQTIVSADWMENFKVKHNLKVTQTRQSLSATDDVGVVELRPAASALQMSDDFLPITPRIILSPGTRSSDA